MIFTLEALRAKRGDALLLHVGDPAGPELMIIDGGWRGVYRKTLKPRLERLRADRAPGHKLPVRLLMVSHIDSDHICGVLDMTDELDTFRLDQRDPPYAIRNLWHNSFDDIVGDHAPELFEAAVDEVGTASLAGEIDSDLPGLELRGALVLASVPQGRDLRNHASVLGFSVNQPVGGLIANRGDGAAVDPPLVPGLETIVVAPSLQRLRNLQEEWDRVLREKDLGVEPDVSPVAYVDKSIPNLASIVVLLRAGNREMLLTGDARGDDILDGMEAAGLLDEGGTRPLDLLKLPHHGSYNNVEEDFFRRLPADHYVVSGDGSHGNPEVETFRMLFAGRAGDDRPFSIHLTYAPDEMRADHGVPYPSAELEALFQEHRASGRLLAATWPGEADLGVRIDLGEPYAGA